MTKDFHLGLGSGALREALEDMLSMHGTEHPKGLVYCRACTNARRLLSLSSPIEPGQPHCPKCNTGLPDLEYRREGTAANWAQASSEIRERVEAELTAIRGQYDKDYGKTNWFTAMDYFCKRVADALDAPSRQGAGGK